MCLLTFNELPAYSRSALVEPPLETGASYSALARQRLIMAKDKYAIFDALNPFFEIVQKGLTGLVDGKHFFDAIADDAFFDFRYNFPGWPLTIRGRADLMDQFSGYGYTLSLH